MKPNLRNIWSSLCNRFLSIKKHAFVDDNINAQADPISKVSQKIAINIARRNNILVDSKVDVIIDVGANTGQYAAQIIEQTSFRGQIISFEPLSSAFLKLSENSKNFSNWKVYNYGLGNTNQSSVINISGNSSSSSLLPMLPSHLKAAPQTLCIGKETIEMRKLDSIYDELNINDKEIYLKIDTQGYEKNVIKGAVKSLSKISIVQLELSLIPLYEGDNLYYEICKLMDDLGFTLIEIERGFTNKENGQLLQVDGIFKRIS